MSKGEMDYPYARNFVMRLNTLRGKKGTLPEYFRYGGYNLWQIYQGNIFNKLKYHTKDPEKYTMMPPAKIMYPKSFLLHVWVLVLSIIAWLRLVLFRVPVLVFGIDKKTQGEYRCDFRMQEVYAALHQENIRYGEVFHSVVNKTTLTNSFARRRSALYIPALDFILYLGEVVRLIKKRKATFDSSEFDFSAFTESEQKLARHIVDSYANTFVKTQRRVVLVKWILQKTAVQKVFAIDSMASNFFELVYAAQSAGIPVYAVQHGHFTKYQLGILPCSEKDDQYITPYRWLLWSDYWKKELGRLGSYIPQASLQIAGGKGVGTLPDIPVQPDSRIGILLPYETDAPKEQMAKLVAQMQKCDDVFLLFKPRADLDTKAQLEEYGFTEEEDDEETEGPIVVETIEGSLAFTQVVVGTYSTFLYDMVGYYRPILLFVGDFDYGEGMAANGLADKITPHDSDASICEKIRTAAQTSRSTLERRQQELNGSGEVRLVDTVRTIIRT